MSQGGSGQHGQILRIGVFSGMKSVENELCPSVEMNLGQPVDLQETSVKGKERLM